MFSNLTDRQLIRGLKETVDVYNSLQAGTGKELQGYNNQIKLTELAITSVHHELLKRGIDATN